MYDGFASLSAPPNKRRKNARQVGWVGSSEAVEFADQFQIFRYHIRQKHNQQRFVSKRLK